MGYAISVALENFPFVSRKGQAMKQASLLERFRFSYTYALLQELTRSLQGRHRRPRKIQFAAVLPSAKLDRS